MFSLRQWEQFQLNVSAGKERQACGMQHTAAQATKCQQCGNSVALVADTICH